MALDHAAYVFRGNAYRNLVELDAWTRQREEPALEPDLPILDPHHHVWDTRGGRYLLDELAVRATFFVTGDNAEARPHLIREYTRRGHQVAGHGYDHQAFTKLRGSELKDQLDRTNALLGPQTTTRPWVRPPYGRVDARVLGRLLAHGTMIAMWSFDSHDYEVHDPDELVARCAPENIAPGDVLLFHEGQQWTLDALPRIVERLRGAGYELVTMAEMIGE